MHATIALYNIITEPLISGGLQATLFYILLDLGITNYNNRSVAQDATHLDRYLPGIMVLKLLLVRLAYLS